MSTYSITIHGADKEELRKNAAEFFGFTGTAAAPKKAASKKAAEPVEPTEPEDDGSSMLDDSAEEAEVIDFDLVKKVATEYMAKHKPAGLGTLLGKFKVKKISEIPEEKWEKFVTEARKGLA